MWRTRAILALLYEDLGGLPADDALALSRARRRAMTVIALEWLAIGVLVVLKPSGPALTGGEQMLFDFAVLAVAAHSGFRLAELRKLGQIERLAVELEARKDE